MHDVKFSFVFHVHDIAEYRVLIQELLIQALGEKRFCERSPVNYYNFDIQYCKLNGYIHIRQWQSQSYYNPPVDIQIPGCFIYTFKSQLEEPPIKNFCSFNHLFYAAGMIHSALELSKSKVATTPKTAFFDDKNKNLAISDLAYYELGLELLKKYNPNLKFYGYSPEEINDFFQQAKLDWQIYQAFQQLKPEEITFICDASRIHDYNSPSTLSDTKRGALAIINNIYFNKKMTIDDDYVYVDELENEALETIPKELVLSRKLIRTCEAALQENKSIVEYLYLNSKRSLEFYVYSENQNPDLKQRQIASPSEEKIIEVPNIASMNAADIIKYYGKLRFTSFSGTVPHHSTLESKLNSSSGEPHADSSDNTKDLEKVISLRRS